MTHRKQLEMLGRIHLQILYIFLLCLTFVISDPILQENEKYEKTRAAVEELNDVMRYLFPIVPHKSQMHHWAQYYRDTLISPFRSFPPNQQQPQHQQQHTFHSASFFSHQPNQKMNISPNKDDVEEENNLVDSMRSGGQARKTINDQTRFEMEQHQNNVDDRVEPYQMETVQNQVHNFNNLSPPDEYVLRRTTSPSPLEPLDNQNYFVHRNSQIPKLDSSNYMSEDMSEHRQVLQRKQQQQQLYRQHQQVHHRFLDKNKLIDRNAKLIGMVLEKFKNKATKQEVTTPSLGKRGPECMRRCIQRGQLHPVQCHSLC